MSRGLLSANLVTRFGLRCPWWYVLALTFSVVAEAHLGLTEANGVFALADAIELLELCLVDALQNFASAPWHASKHTEAAGQGSDPTYLAGEVKLDGLDTDVLGSLRHDVYGKCVRVYVWL